LQDRLSFKDLKKFIFGFNNHYILHLVVRFEILPNLELDSTSPTKWYPMFKIITNIFPKNLNIQKKNLLHILLLDTLQSYRGWRHSRGFPVHGQRTWSNGSSSYKSNMILRKYKLKLAQKVYSQLPPNEINTLYLAEQMNSVWKVQWENEWNAAKKSRLKLVRQGGTPKADLINMSRGNVVSPQKLKKMNKKQKQALKKNHFSLGFDTGFTKKIVEEFYRSKSLEHSKRKSRRMSVLNTEDKKNKNKSKKKKIDVRTQKIKHNLKKKNKKSVWD